MSNSGLNSPLKIKTRRFFLEFYIRTILTALQNNLLQKLDTIIGQLSGSWDGTVMICGDMNINTLDSTNPILNLHEATLNPYNITRHINEPTRGNKVLDHIISNSPSQIKHCGVIPCPQISNHDSPYVIFDTKSRVYKPRYKYIRSMKTFDQKTFVNGFSNLPFSVIDGVDEPEDKLEIFNALITQYVEDNAPLKRIKITRAPAPGMNVENGDTNVINRIIQKPIGRNSAITETN